MVAAGVGIWAPGENPGTHDEALAAVKLALEVGGGKVNDIDQDGETALHGAVYRGGAIPVIQLLIDKGSVLDVKNKRGWTPVIVADGVEYTPAVLKRYPEAAALLRKTLRDRGLPVPPPTHSQEKPERRSPRQTDQRCGTVCSPTEQAGRGQDVYTVSCAPCHKTDLLGDSGTPALAGMDFFSRFNGSSVDDLVKTIRASMPQDAPDSLGTPAYVDLVSYILLANGGPAGSCGALAGFSGLENSTRDQPEVGSRRPGSSEVKPCFDELQRAFCSSHVSSPSARRARTEQGPAPAPVAPAPPRAAAATLLTTSPARSPSAIPRRCAPHASASKPARGRSGTSTTRRSCCLSRKDAAASRSWEVRCASSCPEQPVMTKPNVLHWHGAAPDQAAVQFSVFSGNLEWKHPVTDEEYLGKK